MKPKFIHTLKIITSIGAFASVCSPMLAQPVVGETDSFHFTFNNEGRVNGSDRVIQDAGWDGVFSEFALPLINGPAVFADLSEGVTNELTPGAYKAGFLFVSGKNGQTAPGGFFAHATNFNVIDEIRWPQATLETVNPQVDWYSEAPNGVTNLTELKVADLQSLEMLVLPRNGDTVRFHFAIKVGGEWYVSEQSFRHPDSSPSFGGWAVLNLPIPAANWLSGVVGDGALNLDFTLAPPPVVATSELNPNAALESIGIYIDTDDFVGQTDTWARVDSISLEVTYTDILTAPEILGEPTAVSIPIGDPFELEVIASGSEPLSYQWRKNGFALTGATRAQYTVVAATQGDEGLYDCVVSNAGGEVTSEQVVVTVTTTAQAPEVTMDPEDSVVTEGESVNLSASVSGTSPLSYQWRKDGEAIPGATQLTYPIAEAQLSDAGSYTLFVTNVAGTAESEPAILTVEALMGPGIVEGPQELTLREGELLSLSVVASGSGPLSYQWRKDGEPIPGATGATLELLGAALTDSGSYDVLVSNVVGSVTSEAVVVTVNPAAVPPSIREAPVDTQVNEGQAVLLTVLATGTEPLSYQWSKDGVELEGETESSLELGEAQLSDAGSYTVEVTNVEGSLESAPVTVTVNEVIAPAITQAPAGVSVTEGDAVNLSVSVSGTGPFMYQWRKDGEVIAGATGSSLEFESSVVGDSGSYDVVVSNYKGSVTSEAALVAVTVPPMIETDPQGVELIEGDALELGVMVSGSAPFTYQWRQDGVEIAGAVSDTLTINAVGLSSGGDYDVVVSNASGSVTSAVASVTVYPLPSLDLTLIQVGGQLQEQLITVTAVPQVSWTATVEVDWLRIPSGFEGSGNGVVRLVIDANETGEARSATVLIGGVEVLVLQGSLPQSEGFDAIVGASALEGGTYNSAWFGVYSYASSDWIEHTELGWLYIGFATEATNLYLYSLTLQSWVWTNEQFFSVLYDFTRGGYIFYFVVEDGGGYLYDYTTLTWSTL